MNIDFEVIGNLSKSPSKKYLRKLIEYVIMSRSQFQSFNENSLSPVGRNVGQDFQLNQAEAQKLFIHLGRLIDASGRAQFKDLQNIFPSEFDSQLKAMLISMIQSLQQTIIKMDDSRLTQAQKLLEFDWRLDMQMANQSGKKSQSMALLQLKTVGDNGFRNTAFQMGIQQIGALHQNLKKIKDQLNSLIG